MMQINKKLIKETNQIDLNQWKFEQTLT